jgi:hypothetical protein
MASEEEIHGSPSRRVQKRHSESVSFAVSMSPPLRYPVKVNSRGMLERICGYVFTAVAKFKRHKNLLPVELRAASQGQQSTRGEFSPPLVEYQIAAREFLIQEAQNELRNKDLEGLLVEVQTYQDGVFPD